jgi:hypothetical protein
MTQSIDLAKLPKLPRHPSTLLKMACDDAEATMIAKRGKYLQAITHYFVFAPKDCRDEEESKSLKGRCAVCFAGAVMVQRAGAACDLDATELLNGPDGAAYNALNYVRSGEVLHFLHLLAPAYGEDLVKRKAQLVKLGLLNADGSCEHIEQPKPGRSPRKLIKAMREIAKKLESIGW